MAVVFQVIVASCNRVVPLTVDIVDTVALGSTPNPEPRRKTAEGVVSVENQISIIVIFQVPAEG